jgi:hypothetical protein
VPIPIGWIAEAAWIRTLLVLVQNLSRGQRQNVWMKPQVQEAQRVRHHQQHGDGARRIPAHAHGTPLTASDRAVT